VASGTITFQPIGTFAAHDTGTFAGSIDGPTGHTTTSGASSGTGTTGLIVGDHGSCGFGHSHHAGLSCFCLG
jgi:hypothetical protein